MKILKGFSVNSLFINEWLINDLYFAVIQTKQKKNAICFAQYGMTVMCKQVCQIPLIFTSQKESSSTDESVP